MANSENKYTPWAAIDFEPITESAWLQAIERELKGKSPDLLIHKPEEHVVIRPFEMKLPKGLRPSPLFKSTPAIMERFWLDSHPPESINRTILNSLEGGCEVMYFCASYDSIFSSHHMEIIMQGVVPEYVSIYFEEALGNHARELIKKHPEARIHVGFNLTGESGFNEFLPCYRFHITADETTQSEKLVALLKQANDMMIRQTNSGVPVEDALNSLEFKIQAGSGLIETICTLRAMHIVWHQFSFAWSGNAQSPVIWHYTAPDNEPDKPHKRLIDLSLEFLAAYMGGADFISCPLPGFDNETVARRMIRNIQHLLREEAGFKELADPVCGSYSFEQISHQIAEKVWHRFQA